MQVRPARPDELAAVGALTLEAYVADGFLTHDDAYAAELLAAEGRVDGAELLVAVDADGRLLGTVTYCRHGSPWAEVSRPGEAEFRMLAVAPAGRGRGIGTALSQWCVERAREQGCSGVALSSMPQMRSAHRIYERLGFVRAPERDWSPVPHVALLVYLLDLGTRWCDQCGGAGEHAECAARRPLEPPRWCARCRRRMVVQVLPRGWSARCSEHGLRTGAG